MEEECPRPDLATQFQILYEDAEETGHLCKYCKVNIFDGKHEYADLNDKPYTRAADVIDRCTENPDHPRKLGYVVFPRSECIPTDKVSESKSRITAEKEDDDFVIIEMRDEEDDKVRFQNGSPSLSPVTGIAPHRRPVALKSMLSSVPIRTP